MASTNTSIPQVHVIWFAFLLFIGSWQLCLCFSGNSSRSGSCIERERQALLSIQKGIYDAHKWLSWNGSDCCRWSGVQCDTTTGHVVKLDLHNPYSYDERPNKSEVSPSLLDLRHLNHLDLSMNYFGGAPIPDFIGSVANLEYLKLSIAGFGGTIPRQLGNLSNLLYLDLSNNAFHGNIPLVIGNLKKLQYLDLLGNSFSGDIPETVGSLKSLRSIDLSYNKIGGVIPETVGNLKSLESLDLSNNSISGEIPKTIGSLTKLGSLGLSNNNISGQIPETVGNLESLESLDLSNNRISGEIPKTIGSLTKLWSLWLSDNNISGQIPETVGNLHPLGELYLDNNAITGVIPRTVGNLCNLSFFDASENNIGGEITGLIEGFSRCSITRLQNIFLYSNNLSGSIPASLGKLSALSVLNLASNSLAGELTEAHFANLTSLSSLDMSRNSLTVNVSRDWLPPFKAKMIIMRSCPLGPKFPPWLRNQTDLVALDLSSAGISENFPDWFWDMGLPTVYLNVSHNYMKGKLPISTEKREGRFISFPLPTEGTGYFNILQFMDLSSNLFFGPIPPTLASGIGNFNALLLADNSISGGIPSAFCEANYLVLNLANNDLSGVLPDCWNNSLSVIDFSDNKLSGGIPSSMGSLMQLSSLHLGNNNLSGKIPWSLQQCIGLITLDLGNNKLSGSIPEWIGEKLLDLKVLRLRSNMLDGNIPTQLSLLPSLQVLDLAGNKLSGTLPPSLGNLKAMIVTPNGSKPILSGQVTSYYTENLQITMKNLQLTFTRVLSLVTSLDLSDNNISGEIPDEFTNLRGLLFLNLSGNHLTGRIPEDIGAMGQLESLDLSMNNLSSTIPPSISDLNFLEHLNLSYNNLSGRIPSGSQLQTLINNPSTYIGNRYLCGLPLLEKCPDDKPAGGPTPRGREEKQDENDSEMIWFYVSLSPGFVVGFWGFLGAVMLKRSTRYAYIQFIDRICDWIYMAVMINSARPKSKRNRGRM